MKSIVLIILFFWSSVYSFSQELIFVNQNGVFEAGTEMRIDLQLDNKAPLELITKNKKINLSSFSFDSIATLTVNGPFIHEYINQYTPEQFKKLDTIVLFQQRRIFGPTPRIFPKMNHDLDSAINFEAGILRSFIDESIIESTFSINIYHTYPLSKEDFLQIQEIKTKLCKEVGVDEKKITLIDKEAPFSTERLDFFNPGTVILPAFIKEQNTFWMKSKAEDYRLVLKIEVMWIKDY